MFPLLSAPASGPGMCFFLTETPFSTPHSPSKYPQRKSRQTHCEYFIFNALWFFTRDSEIGRIHSGTKEILQHFKMGPRNSHQRLHLLETNPRGAESWWFLLGFYKPGVLAGTLQWSCEAGSLTASLHHIFTGSWSVSRPEEFGSSHPGPLWWFQTLNRARSILPVPRSLLP